MPTTCHKSNSRVGLSERRQQMLRAEDRKRLLTVDELWDRYVFHNTRAHELFLEWQSRRGELAGVDDEEEE